MTDTVITLQRGEYRVDRATITNTTTGAVVDLTGATIKLVVLSGWYPAGTTTDDTGALLTKTVGSGLTLSDPTNGIFDIEWNKTDFNTVDFALGRDEIIYRFGAEVILLGETYAIPALNGIIKLSPDTVRAI